VLRDARHNRVLLIIVGVGHLAFRSISAREAGSLACVRGRTTPPAGMVLGHEITGEIIEIGRDIEYLSIGDLVSVPFNVACGRCRTCREGNSGVCLNVNPERAGGAYGYVDMGGWIGGQAEYVMVPYADFNCLKFPDKAQALEKIRDLTCLPTGFHGAVTAKVGVGSTVYVAGAGLSVLPLPGAARILGAAVVLIGDMNRERLAHAAKVGFETTFRRMTGWASWSPRCWGYPRSTVRSIASASRPKTKDRMVTTSKRRRRAAFRRPARTRRDRRLPDCHTAL
jgi:hypothetical protein